MTAAAASNPAGVIGVLNFEGAHGSVPGRTCSPDRLVADVGIFGGTASRLHLPTSLVVELPPPAAIPPPMPLNAACTGYFEAYVKAWTDVKAYAWNRDGHCSSVTVTQRTIDDAKSEALRQCVAAGKGCSLYAVGQALAPG